MNPRILVISERAPLHPRDGGDGITVIAHALRALDGNGVEVMCVWPSDDVQSFDGSRLPRLRGVRRILARFGRYPGEALKSATPDNLRQMATLAADADALIFVGTTGFLLAQDLDHPRMLFHSIDPFSLVWMQNDSSGIERWRDRGRSRRARRLELFGSDRGVLAVISRDDADLLQAAIGRPVESTELGYEGRLVDAAPGFDAELCFAGKLAWEPNRDSSIRLVNEVLPQVLAHFPDATLQLIGQGPGPEVMALVGDHVQVLADVPDVVQCASRCKLAVFPGGFGWGIRSSVLNMLAAGTPVVASTTSACGIPPTAAIRIADTDADMAAAAVQILSDDALRARMSEAATALMSTWPTWIQFAERLVQRSLDITPATNSVTS